MAEQEESKTAQADRVRRMEEEIRRLPVRDHLFIMMHSLSELAVARMGLTGEPGSGRDLAQARLAIEAFRALLGVVEAGGPSQEIGGHRALLAQLQLAYASAVKSEATQSSEGTRGENCEGAEPGTKAPDPEEGS